jgi:hypothetical protein
MRTLANDDKTQREHRLAAALRANLARRKDEARRPAETDGSRQSNQTGADAGGAEDPGDKG